MGSIAREHGDGEAALGSYDKAMAVQDEPDNADALISGFTAWLAGELELAESLLARRGRAGQVAGERSAGRPRSVRGDGRGMATAIRTDTGVPVPNQEEPDWQRTQDTLREMLTDAERYAAFALR